MNHEIGCVHFKKCSGCVINSCDQPPELFSHAKAYFNDAWDIDLSFKMGAIHGWRCRAKLAVRPLYTIGLFEKGTHFVIDIPYCQVHHPTINKAINTLQTTLKEAGLSCYSEKSHTGDLRYVQCIVERSTGLVQLTLVLNREDAADSWKSFVKQLYKSGPWHSIWFNFNDKATNTIFGNRWEKAVGNEVVWERIANHDVAFGPSHFGQANLEMYEQLIYDIQKRIPDRAKIAELYAGIGTIGLSLAERSEFVRLSELEANAEHYFTLAKNRLPTDLQKKLTYTVAKAEECLGLIKGVDVCIVDPPRKGLGQELMHKILSTAGLKKLVYVSCDWNSLERDLSFVPEGWKVTHASSYLFFPGTNQIETLVLLEKAS